MKGFAVTAIIAVVLFVMLFLFILGIGSHWKPVAGDVLGIITFFNAVQSTIGNNFVMGNYVMWLVIFYAVQGGIIYAYYMVARFIWVHVPTLKQWVEKTKGWIK